MQVYNHGIFFLGSQVNSLPKPPLTRDIAVQCNLLPVEVTQHIPKTSTPMKVNNSVYLDNLMDFDTLETTKSNNSTCTISMEQSFDR